MPPRPRKPSRRYRIKAASNPAKPYFALLDLPAELRNWIYRYALTALEGVTVAWRAGSNRRKKKPVMVLDKEDGTSHAGINMLQFVNRQLRQETAGLEIQYNRVTFTSYPRPQGDAMLGLYIFVGSCAPTRTLWLTHVVLEGFHEPDRTSGQTRPISWIHNHATNLLRLVTFCLGHSYMRVDFRMPGFTFVEADFMPMPCNIMCLGVLLTRLFKGLDISHITKGIQDIAPFDELLADKLGEQGRELQHQTCQQSSRPI